MTMNLDLTAIDAVDPKDSPGHFGPPRADEPRDADDFSASDVEGDIAEDSPATQPGHLQGHRPRIMRSLRELLRQLPSHHQADQIPWRRPCHWQRRHQLAVSENRDPIADSGGVFQVMGNEDDRGPLVA
jgi:hypothetical protein